MFSQVTFVLSHPSHPGNIGACARAMKTMGFSNLRLVNPKDYPCQNATAMASGAHDVLKDALVVPSMEDALQPFHYTIGASARHRRLSCPMADSKSTAIELVKILSDPKIKVAFLFGTERSGLTNAELEICDRHVYIPSNPEYGSLNLAQAVQVIAYELRMHFLENNKFSSIEHDVASFAQKDGFYQHLEATLQDLDILNPKQPKKLMSRMRRMFNRAQLDETEINILRGILSAAQKLTLGKA